MKRQATQEIDRRHHRADPDDAVGAERSLGRSALLETSDL